MYFSVGTLRQSFRIFHASPGFAITAVLAFALGLGANSSIFAIVSSILLKPLGYANPDRLVVIEHSGPSPVAPATFLDWKQDAHSFSNIAAAQSWGGSLRSAGRPEPVAGLKVSGSMFSLLGVTASRGRTIQDGEDSENATPVLVIAHSLWQRSFGADPNIVGRRVEVDGNPFTVIGVMPPSFRFAPFWVTKAEMWSPLQLGQRRTDRSGKSLRVFARLKDGVALEGAQAELNTIMARLAAQYPDSTAKEIANIVLLRERVVGNVKVLLLLLSGAVGFVLLVACANAANLLLARSVRRRRETAVRFALGATRRQIAVQAVVESAFLAGCGGLVGVLFAYVAMRWLAAALPVDTLPRQAELGLDWRVVVFTIVLSLCTGVFAGILPALRSAGGTLNDALKSGGRGGTEGRTGHRTHNTLIAVEVALAFVLLIGAGLMVRSIQRLFDQDAGFQPKNLLSMELSVAGTRQAEPQRRAAFYRQVMESVASLPGVKAVSAINHAPISGDVWGTRFRIEGRPDPVPGAWPNAVYRVIEPNYFVTMQTPLLAGRDFSPDDAVATSPVVIVNETLARKHWPNGDAVGRRIAGAGSTPWATVVGVVHDAKQQSWEANPRDEIYYPYRQSAEYLTSNARHFQTMTLMVRVEANPLGKIPSIRDAIAAIDADVLVRGAVPMEQAIAENTWRPRLTLTLLSIFALIALLLALTGIYSVINHSMAQRTQEMGIRIAVGASQLQVLRSSVMQALVPIGAGIAFGAALAAATASLMKTLIFGVDTIDPLIFAAVGALLLTASIAATLWPAWKGSTTDPVIALRQS